MFRFVATLLSALFLTSCASLFSNREYVISVESNPPGADVRINRRYGHDLANFKTPGSFDIHYGEDLPVLEDDLMMTLTRKGCKKKVVRVSKAFDWTAAWNALFWPFMIVDVVRGSMWEPDQEEYYVRLEPETPGGCVATKPAAAPKTEKPDDGPAKEPEKSEGQPPADGEPYIREKEKPAGTEKKGEAGREKSESAAP